MLFFENVKKKIRERKKTSRFACGFVPVTEIVDG